MYNQFDKRGPTVIPLEKNVGGARGAAVTPLGGDVGGVVSIREQRGLVSVTDSLPPATVFLISSNPSINP